MNRREYGYDTWLESTPPYSLYSKARVMCSDGRPRNVSWIYGTADTAFSIPCHVKIKGKTVSGYATIETAEGFDTKSKYDPPVLKFIAYTYGKNHELLPYGKWRRQGSFSEAEWKLLIQNAELLGKTRGRVTASWVFDGNTSRATYEAYQKGLDEGDPLILDQLPTGLDPTHDEWGIDALAVDLGIKPDMPRYVSVMEQLWNHYEAAYGSSVQMDVERQCNYQLAD